MTLAGKLEILVKDEATCIVRWSVDNIWVRMNDSNLRSHVFLFMSNYYALLITCGGLGPTYAVHFQALTSILKSPCYWKLLVEGSDGRILQASQSVKTFLTSGGLPLGYSEDFQHLLNRNGSLVVLFELRRIQEGTGDDPSATLQHPVNFVVKESSALPVKNRKAADDASKSSVLKPVKGEHGAHLSTRTFGTLQKQKQTVVCTWIMPNFRDHAERETCLYSDRFQFGSSLWQLRLFHESEAGRESKVLLSLEGISGCESSYPFTWKLSTEDVLCKTLQSSEGICKDANDAQAATLPLGTLRNAQRFLDSDGVLRVACKLQLPKETKGAFYQDESEAGTNPLARDYGKLLLSGEATDAIVRVKGEKEFPVHRAVLVARIPVFASMFRHRMSETESGVVKIEDCDPDTFRRFLHFVYTGSVNDLCPENAMELYRVADKYQVDELKSKCLEYIRGNISVQSFCSTISLALQHCERELTDQSTEFFIDNTDDILLTVEWQEFLSKNPIQANELIVKAFRKKAGLLEQALRPREPKN